MTITIAIAHLVPAAGAKSAVTDTSILSSCAIRFNLASLPSETTSAGDLHVSACSCAPRTSPGIHFPTHPTILFVHAGVSDLAPRTRGLAQHAV